MTGFEQATTAALRKIQRNLLDGLDRVAEHLEAGTFDRVGPKGAAPPSQSGCLTLALLDGVDAELARRAPSPACGRVTDANVDAAARRSGKP